MAKNCKNVETSNSIENIVCHVWREHIRDFLEMKKKFQCICCRYVLGPKRPLAQQKKQRTYVLSYWVRARSQLGTRYIEKQLKTSCLSGNELVPSVTENTSSGINVWFFPLFFSLQIEIVSTSYNRTEALYPCCPEKYPNLALTVVFKQKAIFHHDKLLTQESEAALHAKHGKHGHKHDSSEENN